MVHLTLVSVILVLGCTALAYDSISDIGNTFAPSEDVGESMYEVPTGFMIGAGSAAYQTEGAWNEDGKGENIWDHFFHARPNMANGDVACDSYHQYKTDVLLVKNLKLNSYRISFSWARLLPNGTTDYVNQKGVDFYNNFINELINNGITPVITLYHWDLPQALQVKGGWTGDASIQDYFVEYAKFAYKTFGDRVQWWSTFNEPHMFCTMGFETGSWAPAIADPGVGLYRCAHNVILAHAKAYQAYYTDYSLQGGQVGITLDLGLYVPLNTSSEADKEASNRAMEFEYGWLADPIMFGEYPKSMRTTIDANSKAEGRNESRLPTFTAEEKKMLSTATDFLGVNHYSTSQATAGLSECAGSPSAERDKSVLSSQKSKWSLGWSESTPWGIRGVLNWIKDRYYNFPMIVMENGYSGTTEEGLNDINRIAYLSSYMRATMRSVNEDYCNVLGYSLWSLMDNLEWTSGYGSRFGVHFTDYDDPNKKRMPKKSTKLLRQIMQTKRVPYYAFPTNSSA